MQAKTCSICSTTFPATFEHFSPNRTGKFGLQSRCRACQREVVRAYDKTEKGKAAIKARVARRMAEIRVYQREYQRKNAAKIAEQEQKRCQSPEYLEKKRRYLADFARKRRRSAEWKAWNNAYQQRPDVKEKRRAQQREYRKRRLQCDGEYALRRKTMIDVRRAVKDLPLRTRPQKWWWQDYLDYSASDLRLHLELQFSPEMTWENHGKVWEIDHIKPLAAFVIPIPDCEDFRRAWSLSNLQPLLKHLNNAKGAKLLAA